MSTKDNTAQLTSITSILQAKKKWQLNLEHLSSREKHLQLLNLLRTSVPYYEDLELRSEQDLPVIDKGIYRDNVDLLMTRNSSNDTTSSEYPYTITTGGSTGEPLTLSIDEAAWYAVNYDFFSRVRTLTNLSSKLFIEGKLAIVFISNKPGRKNTISVIPSLNNSLYLRFLLSTGVESLEKLLLSSNTPILYGKPNYLLDLRRNLQDSGLTAQNWPIKLIMVSGEILYTDDRKKLVDFFGAPIVDAYASTEGGLIAVNTQEEHGYQVISDNVWLEVLRDDGQIDTNGRGEILLTNLNYLSGNVVARYRTGDYGELRTDDNRHQTLRKLFGKEQEEINFSSKTVARDEVVRLLSTVKDLEDYKFLVGEKHTNLHWSPRTEADKERVLSELASIVSELLPSEDISFERCDSITPAGGKKRRFTSV